MTRPNRKLVYFQMQVSFMRPTYRLEELVIIYRMQSCLWNLSDRDYVNKEKRKEAYATMISHMFKNANISFTNDELKRTIKRLHNQYVWIVKNIGEDKLRGLGSRCFANCAFLKELLDELLNEPNGEDDDELNTIKVRHSILVAD